MRHFRFGLVLHFSQPYWQPAELFRRVVTECYQPIFQWLRDKSVSFGFSASIDYTVIELLEQYGYGEVLEDIRAAVCRNSIELLGSTSYHPILPLIPAQEARKQVIHAIAKSKFSGIDRNSQGFFPPELAFSKSLLPMVRAAGYQWTVMADCAVSEQEVPCNYIVESGGMQVFLASLYWARYLTQEHPSFSAFRDKLMWEASQWIADGDGYVVVALEAELFGYRHPGLLERFLIPLHKEWGSGIHAGLEQLRAQFPSKQNGTLRDSSWLTTSVDLNSGTPFARWDPASHRDRLVFWRLLQLALHYSDQPKAIHQCLKLVDSRYWEWVVHNPDLVHPIMREALEVVNRCGTPSDQQRAKECYDWFFWSAA